MSQPEAQGSYKSQTQVSRAAPISQLQNTFLSSSEYNNFTNIGQLLQPESTNNEKNVLALDFLQGFSPEKPIYPFEALLSHGMSPNYQDSDGRSLLMLAASKGSLELVQKCIDFGAQIDLRDNFGDSALIHAINANAPDIRIVSLLLDKRANINDKSRSGMTPLLKAVEKGHYRIAEMLIKRGSNVHAKVESSGDTALHLAAKRGDKNMIRLLLENKCDLSKKNKKRQTIWDICKENSEIIDILKAYQSNREDNLSQMQGINSENLGEYQNSKASTQFGNSYKGRNDQGRRREIEVEKTNGHGLIRDRENNQRTNEDMINTQDTQGSASGPTNRNDDNCSNASTTCSNAHSEYHFRTRNNNQTTTTNNTTTDEAGKFPDKNFQSSNQQNVQNRKREDSGVSRTSLTSVHSDMVSDNESMSVHSQNNVNSDYSSQYLSPELHEKTISTGSIGSAEPNIHSFVNQQHTLRKNRSYAHPNLSGYNNSDQTNNMGNSQKRKSKKFFPQGGNPSESYQSQYQTSGTSDSIYESQKELSRQGIYANFNHINREYHENSRQQQRFFHFNEQHGGYHDYNNRKPYLGMNQPGFSSDSNAYSPNPMVQQHSPMCGPFPSDSPMMANPYVPIQNSYVYKQYYPQNQGIQSPIGPMLMNMQDGYNQQIISPRMTHGVPQGQHIYFNYYQQQGDNANFQNQFQPENARLSDKYKLKIKDAKEGQKELEIAKHENNELKALIEATSLTSKGLEELLKEKEAIIQSLIKQSEELERSIKEKDPTFVFGRWQSQGTATQPLLANFCPSTIEDIVMNRSSFPKLKTPFEIANMLHEEIIDFEKAIDGYNQKNEHILNTLLKLVQKSLVEIIPKSECIVYGSFATGLNLPWSDIDIVVKVQQPDLTSCQILELFESHLQKKEWVANVKTIQNKTVPLLKITCSNSFLNKKIDITVQDPRHNGLACVELVKEYLTMYPPLRAISLVLKHFLSMLGLNDTYSGGLSSYGLVLMIVYYLQEKGASRAMLPVEEQNFGELLLSLLACYGFEYDYRHNFVVCPQKSTKGTEIDQETHHHNLMAMVQVLQQQRISMGQDTPIIVIQDPISSRNNIGRSTFRINQIKNAFMAAYFEAGKPCSCEIHENIQRLDSSEDKKDIKCTSILKRMFLAYKPEQ